MTGNDRKRSVNPPNFWSFNFIDVKGLPLQFGSKTFTGFEIADLETWSCRFLLLLCSKKEDFWRGPTSEGFPVKLKWQALDIYDIEWPKVDGHYWPPSIISSHFKKAILLYSYLMGYIYFCPFLYHLILCVNFKKTWFSSKEIWEMLCQLCIV